MAEGGSDSFELGDRVFRVEGFTFDQLKTLIPRFADAGKPWEEGGIDAQREIIGMAVDGQISADELNQMKVRLDQIDVAIGVISKVSGLEAMGEKIARANQTLLKAGTTSTPSS